MKFLLLGALLVHFLSLVSVAEAVVELTSEQFNAGITNGDYDLIVDVRTQSEWDAGHIDGATLVIDLALGGEERYRPIAGCKNACVIAVYCRSGSRARAAAAVLEAAGFNAPVYNGQGVSQWTAAGYPLVTDAPSSEPECMTNGAFICPNREEKPDDVIELTAEEFHMGIQNGDYDIVIDVRRQDEWDAGHIENATLVIDLALGGTRFTPILACKDVCAIAVYCRSGSRARAAANFLASVGFATPIYNGQGINQWTAAGHSLVNTPSYQPECLLKENVVCETGSAGFGTICFSGDMEVQVKDKGFYKMKDLRVGDQVLVNGDEVYESIYSLAHADATERAQFLKFLPSGLELSENHMVFVENKGAIPAQMVRVGDKLMGAGAVEQIKTVIRRGVFAPFTKSGTIIVNGVLASTFIAFQPSGHLTIGSFRTPFSYQWLARTFQLAQYWFGSNDSANDNKEAMSSWIVRPLDFANWLLSANDEAQQSTLTMTICLFPIITVLMLMRVIDLVLMSPCYSVVAVVVLLVSFFALRRDRFSFTSRMTIRNPKKCD